MPVIAELIPRGKKRVALLGAGLILTVGAVAGFSLISARSHGSVSSARVSEVAAPKRPVMPIANPPLVAQNNPPVQRIDAEHITLRRTGFEPEEFTLPAGRFLLSIDNLSELGELTFRLVRQNGNLERDLPAKQDKYRLRHVVDLSPGRYALVVVDHPAWVCHITITAQ